MAAVRQHYKLATTGKPGQDCPVGTARGASKSSGSKSSPSAPKSSGGMKKSKA